MGYVNEQLSKVFKYELKLVDEQEITVPEGTKLLHVDIVDGKVYVWAQVFPNRIGKHIVGIRIAGTGHPINYATSYIGTVIDREKGLVWHVFEHGRKWAIS